MAERIPVESTVIADDDAEDRVREASALGLLITTRPGPQPPALREVRERARGLWLRSRTGGASPTRAELDELWAMIPEEFLRFARSLVAHLTSRARVAGSTATPQAWEPPREVRDQHPWLAQAGTTSTPAKGTPDER